MIHTRPMTMEDSDFMLELKNYPETRAYAIVTHEEIKKEDHEKWLAKNFLFFFVIMRGEERIGVVRIFGGEISIWLDRKFWGLGIATSVIKAVAKKGNTAKIVDGNVASFKAFVRSGFVPVAHSMVDKYYLLQL